MKACKVLIESVVLFPGKFPSPRIELKVQQGQTVWGAHGDWPMVSGPGIVRGRGHSNNPARQPLPNGIPIKLTLQGLKSDNVLATDYQVLKPKDCLGDVPENRLNLIKDVSPICSGMWPGQHYGTLRGPLGGQLASGCHFTVTLKVGKAAILTDGEHNVSA